MCSPRCDQSSRHGPRQPHWARTHEGRDRLQHQTTPGRSRGPHGMLFRFNQWAFRSGCSLDRSIVRDCSVVVREGGCYLFPRVDRLVHFLHRLGQVALMENRHWKRVVGNQSDHGCGTPREHHVWRWGRRSTRREKLKARTFPFLH